MRIQPFIVSLIAAAAASLAVPRERLASERPVHAHPWHRGKAPAKKRGKHSRRKGR